MHPEKYLAHDMPVKLALNDLSATLGKDWKRADEDVNGEFGYLVVLSEY